MNRIIGHAMGKDFNSKGLDKRLSTNGISKGVNRFVHNATFVSRKRMFDLTNPGRFFYPNMRHIIPPEKKKEGISNLRTNISKIYLTRLLVLNYDNQIMNKEENDLFLLFYIAAPAIVDSQFNAQTLALFGTKFHLPF
ncbi:hypothetical protein MAL03_20900 (plasmid) [Leptospira noguchii]|uniref:Uncharacterized protein n=1 Tax=Leptospira noguchii TaxID=28182 RepID=A0AAE9GGY0_9LEPT|nr:hypothetical protein [Leptospira noguchii]UOG58970.1 hypothetical protein MAL03_20900 [Leptospira noguchii]